MSVVHKVNEVLIIGAGITGAVCSNYLTRFSCGIDVWEKSRGSGECRFFVCDIFMKIFCGMH